jgi:CheY-like chemotaxis protein
MSPEVIAKVFEPFFTTKPKGKGTGLGLSIVYGIVQQSGGTITVQSREHIGTTFEIMIPRAIGQPTEKNEEPPPTSTLLNRLTVLIVEDETTVREFIATSLLAHGCIVFSAAGAEEARKIYAEHADEIQVLLSDVIMPNTGGPELAMEFKAQKPALSVMFVSGYTDDRIDEDTLVRTGAMFLKKPFTVGQLIQTLKKSMEHTKKQPSM